MCGGVGNARARPIHTSNSKKGMGCGNVFSFLNESRGFVEFYRIGSKFNFVAYSG
jgi:hypothetical protein